MKPFRVGRAPRGHEGEMIGGRRFSTSALVIVIVGAALSCGGRSSLNPGEVELDAGSGGIRVTPQGGTGPTQTMPSGGRVSPSGGDASSTGGSSGSSGGGVAVGGAPPTLICGLNIDDLETGSGRICSGVEGRVGVWYAFNDGSGVQWPAPTVPGVPISTSAIPDGRGQSERAIHSYGSGFTGWGVGIGFDLAFDGTEYGLYDAHAYDGITFWAKGEPDANADAPATLTFRVSSAGTTLAAYGGRCPDVNCARPPGITLTLRREWTQYWVPFSTLGLLERGELTNVQFMPTGAFDIWVDDVSFFVGAPDCCSAQCRQGFTMPDSGLTAAVQQAIGQPSQALSCGNLCALYGLNATRDIQALRGLECAPALVTLSLSENQIRDLTPLAGLAELRSLTLHHNRIEDVSPLAALNLAGELQLSYNLIHDLTQLTGLDSLRSLDLSYNQVEQVSLHGGLGALTSLSLAHNPVRSVVAPFDPPSLARLDLSDCLVSDVSGLKDAPGLTDLALQNNQLASLASFSGLRKISSIDLSNNHIANFVEAPALPTLQSLTLPNNGTTGLAGIEQLPALSALSLRDNQLADLSPLAALRELTSLDLSNNTAIEDLAPLRDLVKMSVLNVSAASVRDISALSRLQRLTSLDISNNHVTHIDALARFAELRTLNASHNAIESIAALSGVTITYFDFSYNQLRELGAFTDIDYQAAFNPRGSAPPGLNLSYNAITDLTGLANSTGLIQSMSIDLRGNPIVCAEQAENIKKLRQRVQSVAIDNCATN